MRKAVLALLLALAVPLGAQICTTATCNAASPALADVLAALPSTSNTNATVVVNIPAGTGTWTTGTTNYTIPTPAAGGHVTNLTIQGATTVNCSGSPGTSGYSCTPTDSTIIVDSYDAPGGSLLSINVGTATFRMTGLTFQGGTISTGNTKPNGFLLFSGTSTSFRIDHSHFNTNTYSIPNAGGGMTIQSNLQGVIDHSVFDMASQNNGIRDYAGLGDFGDTNWSQATNFGTSGFLFAEDDVFNHGAANDCDAGGKMVIRYSNIYADPGVSDTGLWQGHSMGQGQQRSRGCRALEVYNNYVLNSGAHIYADGDGGSGTGLVWGNSVSGYDNDVVFLNYRELATGHSQTDPPNGIGYCGNGSDGNTSAWDGNSSAATGYPCINQTGRGQGDLLNGLNFPNALNTATGSISWPHNKREPWYIWNETVVAGNVYLNPTYNGVAMQPNRDFYAPAASFNGSTGTGFGAHTLRPANCTSGPGGTYDTSPGGGSYGVLWYSTDTLELDVCDSTNHWAILASPYPYTYPHPLDGGGTPSYSLGVSTVGTGTVTGTNSTPGSYTAGTTIGPLTANPGGGYTFSGWSAVTGSAACSGTTNPCPSFAINANTTVTANFSAIPVCGNPSQVGPNFSNTYTCSGVTCTSSFGSTSYPLAVGFSSPDSCTMHATFDGSAPTCGSPTYGGSTSLSATETIRVIDCQGGSTSSAIQGGTWTIIVSGPGYPNALTGHIQLSGQAKLP